MRYKNSSIWIYPWDLADEGIDQVVARLADNPGVDWLAVTTVYHSGKFLLPHNPKKKLYFPQSGTLYFQPSNKWYGKLKIKPPVWEELAQNPNFWSDLKAATDKYGIKLAAWTLGLHNTWLASTYPECAIENVFGDKIATDLCPNNPDVQDYVCAVVDDISNNLPVEKILIESLEYMPFAHGYHHEVLGVPMSAAASYFMSMCFCEHCQRVTTQAGLDASQIKSWVKENLDTHFANPFADNLQIQWAEIRSGLNGEIGKYVDLRAKTITDLTNKALGEVKSSGRQKLGICDFGPLYQLGPDALAWESGTDLASLCEIYDEICPTFYFVDKAVIESKVEQYLELLKDKDVAIAPAVRAILPQVASLENLKMHLAPLNGKVDGVSFYNYGFMANQTFDWIKEAMQSFSLRKGR